MTVKWSDMTGYVTKLKEEMEVRLGCGIEVVEDPDLGCSCKFEFARNYARSITCCASIPRGA